jgi:hypothetical protein
MLSVQHFLLIKYKDVNLSIVFMLVVVSYEHTSISTTCKVDRGKECISTYYIIVK